MGEAHFVAPKTVVVDLNEGGTRTITGERVILSVGTRATIPKVPGLADAQPMTHVEALGTNGPDSQRHQRHQRDVVRQPCDLRDPSMYSSPTQCLCVSVTTA